MEIDENILAEGLEHHRAGQLSRAEKAYRKVLQSDSNNSDALHLLGVLAHQTGEQTLAESLINRAIKINSKIAKYHGNLGSVLNTLGRREEALISYEKASVLDPNDADFLYNTGTVLVILGRPENALKFFKRAIELRADYLDARLNLASTFSLLSRDDEAEKVGRETVILIPQSGRAHFGLGQVLMARRKFQSAAENFEKACQFDPDNFPSVAGLINSRLEICDWSNYDEMVGGLIDKFSEGDPQISELGAFGVLSLPLTPKDLSTVANLRASGILKTLSGKDRNASVIAKKELNSKIRVGFISSDFRDHPVGHMIAALFKNFTSNKLEYYAYSTGKDDNSVYRNRVEVGADKFIDLRQCGHLSPEQAASHIAKDDIDILVDLGGMTRGGRPDIVALRPAPLLVAWLGFPGTTGGLHDYILVGPDLVTAASKSNYREALVTLPLGWMIPDDTLKQPNTKSSRIEFNLPENLPILCCFNSAHKIEPNVFSLWMRILSRIPEAILWFRLHSEPFINLQKAATEAGINSRRLVNSPRIQEKQTHLARQACADLFLDTLIFNGHSTALDALWAGVPIITCPGETFQSRVVAAILREIGLDDLIVEDIHGYEEKVVEIFKSPVLLSEIKNRLTSGMERPPFQTLRFSQGLENAFTEMWRLYAAGFKPTDFEAQVYANSK